MIEDKYKELYNSTLECGRYDLVKTIYNLKEENNNKLLKLQSWINEQIEVTESVPKFNRGIAIGQVFQINTYKNVLEEINKLIKE